MEGDRHRIVVASYAPERLRAVLEECRRGDGEPIVALTPEALEPSALEADDIVVADLTAAPPAGRPALETLALSGHLVLGLFDTLDSPAARAQLAHCTEVAVWPAAAAELAAKLERLGRLASVDVTLADELTVRLDTIGESRAFRDVFAHARKFARCDAPIMVTGETGTGKEKVARIIHYLGAWDGGPFIAVNCGALPDSLVENELFGHVKGAYTDAGHAQRGLVEQADGGTLFLDEIETLTRKGQVALLRFLQDFEYRPLGAERTRRARLRLITATNVSLEALVDAGEFRRDLLYRLNILALEIPPLRERGGDSLLLAEHFLDRYRERYEEPEKYLSKATLEWIQRYDWPGNVRELENLLLRAFLLADGPSIELPESGAPAPERRSGGDRRNRALFCRPLADAKAAVVDAFERHYLDHALETARGNVSRAARQSGKDRRSFTRLMVKHGLERGRYLRELDEASARSETDPPPRGA